MLRRNSAKGGEEPKRVARLRAVAPALTFGSPGTAMKEGKGIKKKQLEMALERLRGHPSPTPRLEQYVTPASIAADALFFAYAKGDVYGKKVADLGCGTGILGIGAKLLGASEVLAVDTDKEALGVGERNAALLDLDVKFIRMDISAFQERCDTVVMNPPFGSQRRHADLPFLTKAMETADVIYTFHSSEAEKFISGRIEYLGGQIDHIQRYKFPIRHLYPFHREEVRYFEVTFYGITKGKE